MIVEDFTHVLPEDKPDGYKRAVTTNVYDLAAANEQAKYFAELRKQILDVQNSARLKYASKIIPSL